MGGAVAVVSGLLACGRVGFAPAGDATGQAAREGCADGSREDGWTGPISENVAACAATWADAIDMRAAATGTPCGRGSSACSAPTDACAPGWSACGLDGSPATLRRLTVAECSSITGRFVGAISHADNPPCTYASVEPWPCHNVPPVCCGDGCNVSGCPDAIWPGATMEPAPNGAPCELMPSVRADGVLCCRDGA